MRLIALIALMGCGSAPKAPVSVRYRDSARAAEMKLSASGDVVAMQVMLVGGGTEIRLRRRGFNAGEIARGVGEIVGVPSERDVLFLDDENQVGWLGQKQRVKLALPGEMTWTFLGGTVDHASHTAMLAFAESRQPPAGLRLFELDTESLAVRGVDARTTPWPDMCDAAGRDATLYIWCNTEQGLRVSRHDRRALTWSTVLPDGDGDALGEVTGDGSALVLLRGRHATSRMRFHGSSAVVVRAQDGHAHVLETEDPLYFVESLTPVPGRPAIAYVRWSYRDFDGVMLLDAAADTLRIVIPADDKLQPFALAVQPDGLIILP